MIFKMRYFFLPIVLSLLLSGCATFELAVDLGNKATKVIGSIGGHSSSSAGSASGSAPRYKIGSPYEVRGVWYYPERDLNYDETGIASWYGDQFAGKPTANGEIFDPNLVSAAHKTLPLPSVVRVTNLENGRTLVVRVNDRGPFVAGRIIDLSREAARRLGSKKNGIARVRVQILRDETLRLEREAKKGNFPLLGELSPSAPRNTASPTPSSTVKVSGQLTSDKKVTPSPLTLLSSTRTTNVLTFDPVETQIFVQIGSFEDINNAERALTRLQQKIRREDIGHISRGQHNNKILHRVRVGAISDVDTADQILAKIIDAGFNDARIVLDE